MAAACFPMLVAVMTLAVPLPAAAATLGELLARLKVGMWEIRSTGDALSFDPSGKLKSETRVSYTCVTEKIRAELFKPGPGGVPGGSGCKIRSEKVSGENFEVIIDCVSPEFGESRLRMSGTIRPEQQRVETRLTFASPPPAFGGVSEMRDVSESRWLRACRADEKPGPQPGRARK